MKAPKFYMAHDDKSVAHLSKQIGAIGLDIENPREQLKPDILKAIT
jgi:hypothetical protein